MENYSLLMGAAALMKMAVEMAAVSMEKPSGGTSPSRRRAGTETPVPQILASRWRRLWKVSRTVAYSSGFLGQGPYIGERAASEGVWWAHTLRRRGPPSGRARVLCGAPRASLWRLSGVLEASS